MKKLITKETAASGYYRISKERFDKLYDENITKKEYDSIIGDIDDRFVEIVKLISSEKNKGWFDYGNCGYDHYRSAGYFDPDEYREYISIGGENRSIPEESDCKDAFPTRWLWTDNDEILGEFSATIAASKAMQEKKKLSSEQTFEAKRLEKLTMKRIITSKLTREELTYIMFK